MGIHDVEACADSGTVSLDTVTAKPTADRLPAVAPGAEAAKLNPRSGNGAALDQAGQIPVPARRLRFRWGNKTVPFGGIPMCEHYPDGFLAF